MGRLFFAFPVFAFPGGPPGIALLLLRIVLGLSAIAEGIACIHPAEGPTPWGVAVTYLLTGNLLLIGFLTPLAAAVAGLSAAAVAVSLFGPPAPAMFDSLPAAVFGATMLMSLLALGPGAFSVDARVFGRREIMIPPRAPRA